MKIAALIVAAGKGIRAGGTLPKQYQLINGKPVLTRTVKAFSEHAQIDMIQTVIGIGHEAAFADAVRGMELLPPVLGGETRQASVFAGLKALQEHGPDIVLIHDAARPLVPGKIITRVITALDKSPCALPVLPVADTIKVVTGDEVTSTLDRSIMWAAQTPQGFRFEEILAAHRQAAVSGLSSFTDDASIAEWAGLVVKTVAGAPENRKLTLQSDIKEAERAMAAQQVRGLTDIRTGNGYDVHAFEPGDSVTLCGIEIPHEKKLKGHSDADVAMHTLTDAILGALSEGDIGKHFPPSDAQWKGAPSEIFLKQAMQLVENRGGMVSHCDITLVCEEPKIGPFVEAMRENLDAIMGIGVSRISVKATTSEKLGFTGRGEGIAALATATVRLPEVD